ncbi:MAG: molecular chaperone DnaJ [Saprospiraceae bacterium]|nr:molecular chaperone DnaJ [Saprospiraceae bacterium]
MSSKRDYYEILGVQKNADADTIKKAYRKVAMQYHPDRNQGDKAAEEKFKEAAEAYEILSDPDKKAKYDRYGHAGVDPNMGGGGYRSAEDIFSQFGDMFGDDNPFSSFFGGGAGSQRRGGGQQGSNLRIKVKLTLEEISKGVKKKIKVKKQLRCQTCNGTGAKDSSSFSTCTTCKGAGSIREMRETFLGRMQTTSTCPSCHGSGKTITSSCSSCKSQGVVMGEENIELDIPAGVEEGMQLSLRGKGNAGIKGGPSGDLLISIEETPHQYLVREGNNVVYDLFINFADAALGTSVEVPTIDGAAKIKIPAGTQAGKVFRLKEKGLPSVHSYGRGDELVNVNIWTPKHLTDKEKEILETLKNSPNFKPHANAKNEDKGFFDRMKDMFH